MRIAINHLTRMSQGYVCAAGVDISSEEDYSHIRPITDNVRPHYKRLDRSSLQSQGGQFSLGAVVELGTIDHRPDNPQVEDVLFKRWKANHISDLTPDEFESLLKRVASTSLRRIFGEELESLSLTAAATPEGEGLASLGVLGPLDSVKLFKSTFRGKSGIRFSFTDPDLGDITRPVTDVRLWQPDGTPSTYDIEDIGDRIESCYIAVGLTRAKEYSRYPGKKHWLQVNNIFPQGDPLWSRE